MTEEMKEKYKGSYLLEIAQRGNGNSISYVICNREYEENLWRRDNQLNQEGKEFIGSSFLERL